MLCKWYKLAFYTEKTILLKYLKIEVDTNLKIILLDYQNMWET